MKARYGSVETNVDKITGVLEGHQNQLLKDVVMLDKMYDANLVYFKELTMYILAGKKALETARETTLAELRAKAAESGLSEDAQAANDYASLCDRFEKKLHDLALTRTISIQMAPQIRPHPEQQHPDGRKDPVHHPQHHPPLEEPDGSRPRHGALPTGDGGTARGQRSSRTRC